MTYICIVCIYVHVVIMYCTCVQHSYMDIWHVAPCLFSGCSSNISMIDYIYKLHSCLCLPCIHTRTAREREREKEVRGEGGRGRVERGT